MRTLAVLAAVAAAPLLGLACVPSPDEYTIEMTPRCRAVSRSISVTLPGSQPTTAQSQMLDRIRAAYSESLPTTQERETIRRGMFGSRLPNDVGNAGTYLGIETRMGTAVFYVERFRGNDDVCGEFQRRLAMTDRLIDLMIGFLREQVKDPKGAAVLTGLLDGEVRKDARNVVLYYWMADVQAHTTTMPSMNPYNDAMARVTQYLVDHGYAKPESLPTLYRATTNEQAAPFLREIIAAKTGASRETVAAWMSFMDDPDAAGKAFAEYLTKTDEYKKLLAETPATQPDTQPSEPDPFDVLTNLIPLRIQPEYPEDLLLVRMNTTTRPNASNGEYVEGDGETPAAPGVVWKLQLPRLPDPKPKQLSDPPQIIWALLATPNDDYQRSHLGEVKCDGNNLLEYCLWYRSLSDAERAQWDKAIEALTPETAQSLRKFTFAGAADDKYAQKGINLVLGYENEPDSQPGSQPAND
jgi:hypothetical protein